VWAADSNLSALDTTVVATSEASDNPPGASIWPMVFAVGAVAVVLGLVSQQSIFTIGLVILLAAGAQWAVQAWAESASTDSTTNAAVRGRLANPLEYPLLGAFAVGGIAYALSRIMLWLSKTNTIVAFVVLATVIACIAFIFAARPSLKRGAIGGILTVGAVAIVAGGVAAGVDGERDIHVHETIAADAALFCNSPEEFEIDEGASQTVSTKAGTYTISLTAAGNLEFDVPGPVDGGSEAISLRRSNPNNIVFRNDSGQTRRLTLDLGPAPEEEATAAAEEGHGADESHDDKSERNLTCTSLVEDGGAQLITVKFAEPSFAYADDDQAFRFYVPGTDAEIDVVVP
jgi:hypothetical protein